MQPTLLAKHGDHFCPRCSSVTLEPIPLLYPIITGRLLSISKSACLFSMLNQTVTIEPCQDFLTSGISRCTLSIQAFSKKFKFPMLLIHPLADTDSPVFHINKDRRDPGYPQNFGHLLPQKQQNECKHPYIGYLLFV